METSQFTLRPAASADVKALSRFLNMESQVHRHLDWRTPLDWIEEQPFYILETDGQIGAVLACQEDPPGVAWVRLFASTSRYQRSTYWRLLLSEALQYLDREGVEIVAAIALQNWMEPLLKASNFEHFQDIVVLEWEGPQSPLEPLPEGIRIRPMLAEDIPNVARLDKLSFPMLWHNSIQSILLAFEQSAYSTVAEAGNLMVGFQISTAVPLSGHMARLAVHPDYRRAHIGAVLTRDMLQHFATGSAWHVTLNTQSTNYPALQLYTSLGFHLTGETFPVYQYRLSG